ncbi:hypothetical protein [Kitasatospora sp. MAP5-34]|uniref:hypothetical protein n=1 Tax=Kitasatospora sp. MAP5-34 TaxID=3035102 RepID=UPI002474947E|nr:hypothetical protein [Kitasatospora sp. MAP5-34]MDH6576701.1 hypothetical protein [Kitasatospora sp. MAP5-34]
MTATSRLEDRGLSGETPTLPAAVVAKVAAAHGQISLQNLTVVDQNNKPVCPTTGTPTMSTWRPASSGSAAIRPS